MNNLIKTCMLVAASTLLFGCANKKGESALNFDNMKNANEVSYYDTENLLGSQTYDTSYETESYKFYYFYIGTISNVPVRTSTAFKCGKQAFDVTLTFSEMTLESFSETVSNTIENVTETTINASVGVNIPITAVSLPISLGAGLDNLRTTRYTTVANKEYISEHSTSESVTLSISTENNCVIGRNYRIVDLNNMDCYGVVVFDKENNSYSVQTNAYIYDKNYVLRAIDESDDDGKFSEVKWRASSKLEFNADSALDFAKTHECEFFVNAPKGSLENPHKISSVSEFERDMNDINVNCENSFMVLTNDLDFNDCSFDYSGPIYETLYGNIVGNGFTIKNLTLPDANLESTGKEIRFGLFGEIAPGALVSSIKFENNTLLYTPNKNKGYATTYGGLVAVINKGEISNCEFSNNNLKIDYNSCESEVEIYLGTIASKNYGLIAHCNINNANVYADADTENGSASGSRNAHSYVGGVVAYNKGDLRYIKVESSEFFGRACYFTKNKSDATAIAAVGGMTALQVNEPTYQACIVDNSVSIESKIRTYSTVFIGMGREYEDSVGDYGKLYAKIVNE